MSEYTLGFSIIGAWLAGSIGVFLWAARYTKPARWLLVACAVCVAVAALSGCTTTSPTTNSSQSSSCVLVDPPPFIDSVDEATDAEIAQLAAWSKAAWTRCAAVGSRAPYPPIGITDGD